MRVRVPSETFFWSFLVSLISHLQHAPAALPHSHTLQHHSAVLCDLIHASFGEFPHFTHLSLCSSNSPTHHCFLCCLSATRLSLKLISDSALPSLAESDSSTMNLIGFPCFAQALASLLSQHNSWLTTSCLALVFAATQAQTASKRRNSIRGER